MHAAGNQAARAGPKRGKHAADHSQTVQSGSAAPARDKERGDCTGSCGPLAHPTPTCGEACARRPPPTGTPSAAPGPFATSPPVRIRGPAQANRPCPTSDPTHLALRRKIQRSLALKARLASRFSVSAAASFLASVGLTNRAWRFHSTFSRFSVTLRVTERHAASTLPPFTSTLMMLRAWPALVPAPAARREAAAWSREEGPSPATDPRMAPTARQPRAATACIPARSRGPGAGVRGWVGAARTTPAPKDRALATISIR